MVYYFTFVFLMLFLTFIENSYKKAIFLSFFLFFLFLGFSYPSGYDFVGYFTNYNCLVNHTCNSDNLIKFESGYNLLVLIFGQLGYQLTIVAIAIFNVVCVFKFIQKNKIGNGRKPKKDIVQKWRLEHPEGKKADCIRDTGLTKPTVYKWWNIKK